MGATLRPNRCTAGEFSLKLSSKMSECTSLLIPAQCCGTGTIETTCDHKSHHLCRVYRLHERLVNLRSDYNLRQKTVVTMGHATLVQSTQQSTIKMRPDLDDKTLRYVQDLLAWVEENQQRIDEAPWGSDLPTVESQLGSHRGLHQTVEDFRSKIERARADEVPFTKPRRNITLLDCCAGFERVLKNNIFLFFSILQTQLSPVSKGTYKEYLGKLDLQYGKLLVCLIPALLTL